MTLKLAGSMDKNTRNVLLGELFSARTYLERIFFALADVTTLYIDQDVQRLTAELNFDIDDLIEEKIVRHEFGPGVASRHSFGEIREKMTIACSFFENLIKLDLNDEFTINETIEFINLILSHAYGLHRILETKAQLEIQYPRVNVIDIKETDEETGVHLFELKKEQFTDIAGEDASINSLMIQRDKKYQYFIHQGHQCISKEFYQDALENFIKAQNYCDTAEVLTLIGWAYSHLEDLTRAKSYCLKAIKKDPEYGPPYNDMGTYLLNEGQVDESFKWFRLAKQATYYQNREYPYINCGRAHMAKKNYQKALEEFSIALTLAPFHEELHSTVAKLKESLQVRAPKIDPATLGGMNKVQKNIDEPPPIL